MSTLSQFFKRSVGEIPKSPIGPVQTASEQTQKILEEYQDHLKVMPRDHDLYKKREDLLNQRKRELIKILNNKSHAAGAHLQQLKYMSDSLAEANLMMEEIKKYKKEIDNDEQPILFRTR